MSEKIKDVNAKIDELEAVAKKYVSKDTVISIGGYEFTPAKLMVAFTLISSILGGLYGTFEVYKDYQGMKKKIAEYVTPDLAEIYKKMEVLDANTSKMTEYTNNIKNDLKSDVRRLEGVVESVERSSKQSQRDVDNTLKESQRDVDNTLKEVNREMVKNQKETAADIRTVRSEVDAKIKKALDNPLSH